MSKQKEAGWQGNESHSFKEQELQRLEKLAALQEQLDFISNWSLENPQASPTREERIATYFGHLHELLFSVEEHFPLETARQEWVLPADVPVLVISDIHGRTEFVERVIACSVNLPDGTSDTVLNLLSLGKIKLAFVGDYVDTEEEKHWSNDDYTPKRLDGTSHDVPVLKGFQSLAYIMELKKAFPDSVYVGQGNHDSASQYGRVGKYDANQTLITEQWLTAHAQAVGENGFLEIWKTFQVRLPLLLRTQWPESTLFVTHSAVRSAKPDLFEKLGKEASPSDRKLQAKELVSGYPLRLSNLKQADFIDSTEMQEFIAVVQEVMQLFLSVDEFVFAFPPPDEVDDYNQLFWQPLQKYCEQCDIGNEDDLALFELQSGIPGLTQQRAQELLALKISRVPGQISLIDALQEKVTPFRQKLISDLAFENIFIHKAFLAQAGITPADYINGRLAWVSGHSVAEDYIKTAAGYWPTPRVLWDEPDFGSTEQPQFTLDAQLAGPTQSGQRFGVETQVCDPSGNSVAFVMPGKDGKISTSVYDLHP